MRRANDPELIENMLDTLLDDLDQNQERYTTWEQQFLESIDDQSEDMVLSDNQVEKLTEIYSDRRCR